MIVQETRYYCDGCGREIALETNEERNDYIRECTNKLSDGKYEYYIIKPVKHLFVGTIDSGECIVLCKECMKNVRENCNYIREARERGL